MHKTDVIIDGKKVTKCRTLKSTFDMDSIEVVIGNKCYRMKIDEVAKALQDKEFTAEKKRVHTYLSIKE